MSELASSSSAQRHRWNWRAAARCRTTDADGLFVTGAQQREARMFCRSCPVRTECLAHALDERIEFGVWGGMTERERRALLRNRPEIGSWYEMLIDARSAYYAADPGVDPYEHTATGLARAAEQAVAARMAQRLHESA
ncbi:WhiB family transcriptional regulator [Pseudonocardia sp.]|uniref:WhiB family transcriptional regulator n=1 Tax=Pseudonocardia sp. TaxID=60912 RepID=UPI0026358673|nr:WhiB family transcriptional regulator [Pseudonocardia sp.]